VARVALFDPCYLAALRPGDASHALRVIEALGDEPVLVDGRCCGQPAFNSGFRAEARNVGRELLRAIQPFDRIVVASGSCTSMISHYLPPLFPGRKGERAARIAARVTEFSVYVAGHPRLGSLGLRLEGAVAYHDSCHYRRELGQTATALALMARIEGLEVRRLAHEPECCGFGGTFSSKLPEVAAEMLRARLDDIAATGARVLVSTDFSCLAHIENGARAEGRKIETWTLSELLARAMG
jgi:L-lactate dehydrogenase complex protein LldE